MVLVQGEGANNTIFSTQVVRLTGSGSPFIVRNIKNQVAEGHGSDIDLYLVPAAGGRMPLRRPNPTLKKHSRGLSWSPDSKEIAFVKWTGEKTDISIVFARHSGSAPLHNGRKKGIPRHRGRLMETGFHLYIATPFISGNISRQACLETAC